MWFTRLTRGCVAGGVAQWDEALALPGILDPHFNITYIIPPATLSVGMLEGACVLM